MYNTILIPIDFAHKERIETMIKAAHSLGNKNARIVLANVVDIPLYPGELSTDYIDIEALTKDAHRRLVAIAKQYKLSADNEVVKDNAASGILEIAENISCLLYTSDAD